MNKRMISTATSALVSLTLVGCSSSSKPKRVHHAATPLTLVNDKFNSDNDMQGLRFTTFDSHNEFKQEIKTAPDAKVSMKNVTKVRPDQYHYQIHKISSGNYQIVFKNNNIRNEAHAGAEGTIVVSSPSYTKQSQVGLFLATSNDAVKQSIVGNVQKELNASHILDRKAKVSIKDTDNKQGINVNVDDDFMPWPSTDTFIAMLKGIKQSDISSFKNIKLSISSDDKYAHDRDWYSFAPYDIKTMPLDNMSTNDLNYIAIDKGSSGGV